MNKNKKDSRKTRVFLDSCDQFVMDACAEGENLKSEKNYDSLKLNLMITLQKTLKHSVKIQFFGSRMIGLANSTSDLDIFIEYGRLRLYFNE